MLTKEMSKTCTIEIVNNTGFEYCLLNTIAANQKNKRIIIIRLFKK